MYIIQLFPCFDKCFGSDCAQTADILIGTGYGRNKERIGMSTDAEQEKCTKSTIRYVKNNENITKYQNALTINNAYIMFIKQR